MKKLTLLLFSAIAWTLQSATVPRIAWTVETAEKTVKRLDLVYGETVDLECRFLNYTRPLDITSAAVTLHAVTNGMESGASFQLAGAPLSNGWVSVRCPVDNWLPAGLTNASYTLEVVQTNSARILRASGTVCLTGTSTAGTNSPVSLTVWTNVLALASNLQSQIDTLSSTASQVVSVNGQTGTVSITASSLGALTAEADAAALSALATNRVTRWYDTDSGLWWQANGGTNLTSYRVTVVGTNYTVYFLSGSLVSMASEYGVSSGSSFPFSKTIEDLAPLVGAWSETGHVATVSMSADPVDALWSATSLSFPQILYPIRYASGTGRVDAAEVCATSIVSSVSFPLGTAELISRSQADARYLSSTPGWFWQGSQQVATNCVTTNLLGCAVVTNGTQLALIPVTASRHDTTGSVELVSSSYMVGISYNVVTPETGFQPMRPVWYFDERVSPTSWLVSAYCSDSPLDTWPTYFAVLTNLVCYGYDRAEMAPNVYTNDAAGIVARVDDANVDAGSRSVVNANTLKAYIDSRKDEIAKRAYDFTPSGKLTPNASVFTVDEPMVQQGQMSWLNSGDYYCMSYGGGDWYSSTTGSVWRIGPSGRVAFEIASTNRVLHIQAFSVVSGSATIDISTNWVVGTPSIEFSPSLLEPQWISCPDQNMVNLTNYWRAVCPADSGSRYFRAVDPSGDNVIRSYTRHEFLNGITIGTNTFYSLSELKALLNSLPD